MSRAYRTGSALAALGAAFLAAAAGALAGETDTPARKSGERVRMVGKVKSVADDGSGFVLQAKGGTFNVTLAEKATVTSCRGAALRDVPTGSILYVLGRAVGIDSGTFELPNIRSIEGIVAAPKDFVPPPVRPEHVKLSLTWTSGTLRHRGEGAPLLTNENQGEFQLNFDRSKVIPFLEAADAQAIAKGKQVVIDGRRADKKAKDIECDRMAILGAGAPAAECAAFFGL